MAKKPRNRTADFAAYLAVRLLVAVVQMASPRIAYAVADGFAWLAFALIKSRRRVALENVRVAFPELVADPAGADRLVRAMYQHFLRSVVELMLLPRKLHPTTLRDFVALPDWVPLFGALTADRPVLIVTAHFGSWEMAGFTLGLFDIRTSAIARELDNPYLDRFVQHFRQRTGQTILDKNTDYAKITAALTAGAKMATLADQDAGPKGVFVDFFGRPASTHKAVALMALEFDAVMIVIGVPRVSRADYPQRPGFDAGGPLAPMFYAAKCGDVIDPREYAADPNAVKLITARYTAAVEKLVREHPEQYFWLHRRWKHQPKAKGAKVAA